jgi:hypothetical protein
LANEVFTKLLHKVIGKKEKLYSRDKFLVQDISEIKYENVRKVLSLSDVAALLHLIYIVI